MRIQNNFDLSGLNTLQLKSSAENYAEIENLKELEELTNSSFVKTQPMKILGGGSNIVIPSFVKGLVVKIANKGRELIKEDSENWWLKASAGEVWHDFVLWTLEKKYWGLENLSLIPGSVGAAPIQNIGAYGVEIKNFVHEVICFDLQTQKLLALSNSDCQFSYRDSIFKRHESNHLLIWEVVFKLPKKNTLHTNYGDIKTAISSQGKNPDPNSIAEAVIKIRSTKLPDPKVIGNVGSFFKNPIVTSEVRQSLIGKFPNLVSYPNPDGTYKLAAGWLIENAGWKGKAKGPVGMFERQALVLVNRGGATAEDVWSLADQVAHEVFQIFGVKIEPEPIRW